MTTRIQSSAKAAMTTIPSFTPVRSGLLQRKCASGGTPGPSGECEACRKKRLQSGTNHQSTLNSEPSEVPPIVDEVLRSPGQPLDSATRAFMELRFDHNFENARVHSDTKSAASARAVNALAYTVGHQVVFGAGRYAPYTTEGQRLIAHELTHVVQQRNNGRAVARAFEITRPGDASEVEAQQAADAVRQGSKFVSTVMTPRLVARQGVPPTDWRDLARRQVPWQQWTLKQKEMAEQDYQAAVKRMFSAGQSDLGQRAQDDELFKLLSPYKKDMSAFYEKLTSTSLDLSARFVGPAQYESAAGKAITLKATVQLPAAPTPTPPAGEMLFEIFKENAGQIDLKRVSLAGVCTPQPPPFLGMSCNATATYTSIPLTRGKYFTKATYQPLNTGNRSSYAEALLEAK